MRTSVAGVLAAAVALAATELLHALIHPVPSLVLAVAQATVRHTPGRVAVAGVESVGKADKPLLVAGVIALSLVIGATLGRSSAHRPRVGDVGFTAFALLGVAAVSTLPAESVAWSLVPATAAAVLGAVSLRTLVAAAGPSPEHAPRRPGDVVGRRRFLVLSGGAAGGSLLAAGGAVALDRHPGHHVTVRLPPAVRSAGVAPTTGLDLAGLSPLVTPNRSFYRIDEALLTPSIDLAGWRLRVTGMVEHPLELSFEELLAEPLDEEEITMACVSNEVGGRLVGNARWRGVRLDTLLRRAGPTAGAEQVVGRSVDGFTVGFPLDVALDGRAALVAVGMNGEALPTAHGFPARLVVPGLYGYVSATKWLTEIELTRWDDFDAYWVERGWAKKAPIKVQSRIDVPRGGSGVAAGPAVVAGVAWAPHRGIARVEVRIDGGPWHEATLGPSAGGDAWRQWRYDGWRATRGERELEVRATTRDGEVQTATQQEPFPDGATGYHRIKVSVR